jgi:two-component sensor histidine kinase
LVLNELITNALKHGPAETELELTVSRTRTGARVELFNNGEPSPEGFSSPSQTGVGLYLIRTLVGKDLQGHFELAARASPRGVTAAITFTPET